ncbi:ribonuclease III [Desertihabitans aurantiacus]|uniref:ribonuclease III n=1 Tax=Desertihabitans aurantiacus TaxID=2282477 RepID=UPI000DF865C6|nr:ribonuclease III [Desertihabitans aurantiacus]
MPARAAVRCSSPDSLSSIDSVLEQLGVPLDPQLFELAVTHRSFAYENGGLPTNERLEFLGDSVLGVVVTEHLYRTHPDLSEGRLAKLRAAVVNARALAGVARGLEVGPHIRLGRGELNSGGHDKSSILADTMEALIGAVHLAHGVEGSARFVHHLFDPLMEAAANLGAGLDWKTSVQELAAGAGLGIPAYTITEAGPDHAKEFEAWLVLGEEQFGPGQGRNKKQAEQEAAALAFRMLEKRLADQPETVAAAAEALVGGEAADGSASDRPVDA